MSLSLDNCTIKSYLLHIQYTSNLGMCPFFGGLSMLNRGSLKYRSKAIALVTLLILIAATIVIVPSDVSAETKPGGTLKNDRPARVYTTGWWWSTIPDELQFKIPSRTNYYTAIAIDNRQTGEDFDLFPFELPQQQHRLHQT